MKILHLSKYSYGGAGQASYQIHKELLVRGISSLYLYEKGNVRCDNKALKFIPSSSAISRVLRGVRMFQSKRRLRPYEEKRPQGFELFSDIRGEYKKELIDFIPQGDILTLHNCSNLFEYSYFFRNIIRKMPIAWRCPDMNLFTGGCHYDAECNRWKSGCGKCPQLGSNDQDDLSARIWKTKKNVFSSIPKNKLFLIAQSNWMAECIDASPILKNFPVTVIANGVNEKVFKPVKQDVARSLLGIAEEKKVVLYCSYNFNSNRKGFKKLVEALHTIKHRDNIELIVAGTGQITENIPVKFTHIENVNERWALSVVYNTADVFVAPYLQDHCPNTVLESLSCGIPVVGFEVGGIKDLVRNGENGYLVKPFDVCALGEKVTNILFDCNIETLQKKARNGILKNLKRDNQIKKYIELYNHILVTQNTSLAC